MEELVQRVIRNVLYAMEEVILNAQLVQMVIF
jgi:hypothetical protein